jgi:hypothetical protein
MAVDVRGQTSIQLRSAQARGRIGCQSGNFDESVTAQLSMDALAECSRVITCAHRRAPPSRNLARDAVF